MNNFKTTIGIETHCVVLTNSKMFSSAKSSHIDTPNSNVNAVDLALPGTLPSVNKTVVIKAIQLANALHMNISEQLIFDRKNYFYQDLPKGFQITQFFWPIGRNGYVEIKLQDGSTKKIHIEEIHIEEDTAKQFIQQNKIFLDYNRSGMPLIEIVTKPDMSSSYEAVEYLKELKRILNFYEISDAKMEEGSLRVDVNISHALHGAEKFGDRIEVKNLNSIGNVAKTIEFETKRQVSKLLIGEKINNDTLRWDEAKQETVFMRSKTSVLEYFYMPEGNLLPFDLSKEFIDSAINHNKDILKIAKDTLTKMDLDEKIQEQLLNDFILYKKFMYVFTKVNNAANVVTWLLVELMGYVNKANKTIESISNQTLDKVIEMIKTLNDGKINGKQAKIAIDEIYRNDLSINEIIEKYNFKQITDTKLLTSLVEQHMNKNQDLLNQYSERPKRVEKFIVGMVMKETNGQANPQTILNIFKKVITDRKK